MPLPSPTYTVVACIVLTAPRPPRRVVDCRAPRTRRTGLDSGRRRAPRCSLRSPLAVRLQPLRHDRHAHRQPHVSQSQILPRTPPAPPAHRARTVLHTEHAMPGPATTTRSKGDFRSPPFSQIGRPNLQCRTRVRRNLPHLTITITASMCGSIPKRDRHTCDCPQAHCQKHPCECHQMHQE